MTSSNWPDLIRLLDKHHHHRFLDRDYQDSTERCLTLRVVSIKYELISWSHKQNLLNLIDYLWPLILIHQWRLCISVIIIKIVVNISLLQIVVPASTYIHKTISELMKVEKVLRTLTLSFNYVVFQIRKSNDFAASEIEDLLVSL